MRVDAVTVAMVVPLETVTGVGVLCPKKGMSALGILKGDGRQSQGKTYTDEVIVTNAVSVSVVVVAVGSGQHGPPG